MVFFFVVTVTRGFGGREGDPELSGTDVQARMPALFTSVVGELFIPGAAPRQQTPLPLLKHQKIPPCWPLACKQLVISSKSWSKCVGRRFVWVKRSVG